MKPLGTENPGGGEGDQTRKTLHGGYAYFLELHIVALCDWKKISHYFVN